MQTASSLSIDTARPNAAAAPHTALTDKADPSPVLVRWAGHMPYFVVASGLVLVPVPGQGGEQRRQLLDVLEGLGGDDVVRSEDRRGGDDVLELPDVARPGVRGEQVHGLGRERLLLLVALLCEAGEEVLG